MRLVKRRFSRPVRLPLKPPAKPMGQETRPLRVTVPLSGRSDPLMMRMSVDLPWPFRPRIPMFTPGRKVMLTSRRTSFRLPCGRL